MKYQRVPRSAILNQPTHPPLHILSCGDSFRVFLFLCENNYRVFREAEFGHEQIFHTVDIVDAAFELVFRIFVRNPAENSSFITGDSNQRRRINNNRLMSGFIKIAGFIKISSAWHYGSVSDGIRPVVGFWWVRPVVGFWSAKPDMNTAVFTAKTSKPGRKP
jgi:hypothetical protein